MTREELTKAVIDIVYEHTSTQVDRANINLSTKSVDLGLDSLDHVEIVMALEEQFDVEISDDEACKWLIVGDAVETVARLRSGEPVPTKEELPLNDPRKDAPASIRTPAGVFTLDDLGRAAYDGWMSQPPAATGSWEDVTPEGRAAWCAAAKAVVTHLFA